MNQKDSESIPAPVGPPAPGATVEEWLHWLEAIHPTEIDLGLDRVLVVLRRLFPRKPQARIITVAGTNGKGTTVTALESILLAAGRSTGAYMSPHLFRYNERVRIGGEEISDAALVSAFERVEAARRGVSLTYFEFGTLAAFVAFADAGVEDWVLEVGLGGRLDAVNVLDPDFAVITSVDIDHIGFLGDNREVIGFEKAGILRPGISAVCADPNPPSSVLQQAAAQKVGLKLTGRDYTLVPGTPGQVLLHIGDEQIELPAGPLPVQSVAAAAVLSRQLVPELSLDSLRHAVRSVQVPGRFETIHHNPDVIIDVGHNPHAAAWLADNLRNLRGDNPGRILAVYGALGDKDVEGVASSMSSVVDQWYLAGLDIPRGLDSDRLMKRISTVPLKGRPGAFGSVSGALAAAMGEARSGDRVIVFGSFFTVALARQELLPVSEAP
ncbi:folylpolyglutamate synthase [Marinobacter sp. EVN1]|uniref:bifunctional tetrahydrofolate synthase/dihydrofolate synthase n=1 Tax=Marinobacter sp. EVN1 TaxID=1397532 RepID=UPI0003B8F9C7|nr:bifunctional tetrahydrofolate synthase/dihydrofolate synthase [Marinobacter sp. EVN1]ERS81560.1 folylpolyglutamate synthase [Marinobacter sp. EVN1]